MANEHDLHPQTYHCRLVQEEIFVLADRDAEDNTHDGIKMTGNTDLQGTPPMSAVRVLSDMFHFKCSDTLKCRDERVLPLGGKVTTYMSSPSSLANK